MISQQFCRTYKVLNASRERPPRIPAHHRSIFLTATCTLGPSLFTSPTNYSTARSSACSLIAPNASQRNSTSLVSSLSAVRGPCRQFHRRHVTPASSTHTTSPRSGCSRTTSPFAFTSNTSSTGARMSRGGPTYVSRSLPPSGISVTGVERSDV